MLARGDDDRARQPHYATTVDSTGIGLMVRFKKNLKRRDVNLKFTNVSPSVRNVIRATQLEEFFARLNLRQQQHAIDFHSRGGIIRSTQSEIHRRQ